MSVLLILMMLSAPSQQDVDAAKAIDRELYPQDRRIIFLIKEEAKRLRLIEERRKLRANMPACPIEIRSWFNLECV